jgi:hypothetical protein
MVEACMATEGLRRGKCQRRIRKRCRAEGLSVCSLPTTTTTLTATTTTTSVAEPATTTTVAGTTTTTLPGLIPVPDVRGTWDIDLYATGLDPSEADSYIDGCGFVGHAGPPAVKGPLLVAGDSYDPNEREPSLSGILGPLTNLNAPTTTFDIVSAKVLPVEVADLADGASDELTLFAEPVCDPEGGCCITAHLGILYGYDDGRPISDGAVALFTIYRTCLDDNNEPILSCVTRLIGNISQQ